MSYATKQMNHAAYQKQLRKKTEAELRYILKDAGEALKVNPHGENAGYYQDEVHYAAAELRRRQKQRDDAFVDGQEAQEWERCGLSFPKGR